MPARRGLPFEPTVSHAAADKALPTMVAKRRKTSMSGGSVPRPRCEPARGEHPLLLRYHGQGRCTAESSAASQKAQSGREGAHIGVAAAGWARTHLGTPCAFKAALTHRYTLRRPHASSPPARHTVGRMAECSGDNSAVITDMRGDYRLVSRVVSLILNPTETISTVCKMSSGGVVLATWPCPRPGCRPGVGVAIQYRSSAARTRRPEHESRVV